MGELRRIRSHVALAMSDEALASDDPRGLLEVDEESHTELVREVDLEGLDRLVVETIQKHDRYDTAMDAAMVIELHRLLPISRREAADRHLWAWLGMVRYPHFVAYRWKPQRNGLRSSDRFIGTRVRQTFVRLWWAAEATVADGDYALTERLLSLSGFQDVYEASFGRAFCQYLPAMAAFVDVVGPHPEEIVRETAKELGYLLTTVVLESFSEDDLRVVMGDLVKTVEATAGR